MIIYETRLLEMMIADVYCFGEIGSMTGDFCR